MKIESGHPLTRRAALGPLAAAAPRLLQREVRKATHAVRHLAGVLGYEQSHPADLSAFAPI